MAFLALVLPVRFHEAIRAAERRRVVLPDDYYGAIPISARGRAFTISGLMTAMQLRQALDDLNEGLRQGMTFGEWKAKALARDWILPETRLELVLRAHTQTAYMAGVYEQAQRTKDRRPYLMYSAINDLRTRPNHAAMDGIIRHIDDPFWDSHFPPCGFNCRCGVITLTEEQARDRGGATKVIPPDARADPGWGFRPGRAGFVIHEALDREAIHAPAPLQATILDYHRQIREEQIIERVRGYLGVAYDRIRRSRDFRAAFRAHQGLVLEHEAVSLWAYTADFYVPLNRFLRAEGGTNPGVMATVSSATSALSKLPAFEGRVHRGAWLERMQNPKAFLEAHKPGEVVQYMGFTSASHDQNRAFAGSIRYLIHSRTGRVVEGLSAHDVEQEVLFAPWTRFRVVRVDLEASPILIELEELVDQTIIVPKNRRFSQEVEDRMQDEAAGPFDPEAVERFMAEHDGLSPIEYALMQFPSAAMEVEQGFPHLVPKKPKKKQG